MYVGEQRYQCYMPALGSSCVPVSGSWQQRVIYVLYGFTSSSSRVVNGYVCAVLLLTRGFRANEK